MAGTALPSSPKRRKRVWAQDVKVDVDIFRARLSAIRTRLVPLTAPQEATVAHVEKLLQQAEDAANGEDPRFLRLLSWWRGSLIEAAYLNLHAAESEIVPLYNNFEIEAEFPESVARVEASLNRDDPRRVWARFGFEEGQPIERQHALLRKLIEVGHNAVDRQHTRLRSFRNIVVMTAMLLGFLVLGFIGIVAVDPTAVPLCFSPNDVVVCPAGEAGPDNTIVPSAQDVLVVALLGLLGGALAAAVSIRNLKGTSTPYDIPVALAWLKVSAGALTAIGAIIAIRGNFIPGLSELDSQEQILAYALVFGYSQQLLTGLIDRRASELLSAVPGKDLATDRPAMGLADPEPPYVRLRGHGAVVKTGSTIAQPAQTGG